MTSNPITLKPDQTVGEAAIIFMDKQIDGAPVIDDNGKLIGLLTKSHVYRVINGDKDISRKVADMIPRDLLTGHRIQCR